MSENTENAEVHVITDATSSDDSRVPFYKNRKLIKVGLITTAVVGAVAVVASRLKSNDDEQVFEGTVENDETPVPTQD